MTIKKDVAGKISGRLEVREVLVALITTLPQGITYHDPPGDKRGPIGDFSKRIQSYGKSVARIRWKSDGMTIGSCTGFLISPALLMTNRHCMRTKPELDHTSVDFDYVDGASCFPVYHINSQKCCDSDLDIAVYSLDREVPDANLLYWAPKSVNVYPDEPLLIIQHPGGGTKKVSQFDCKIVATDVPGSSSKSRDFSHYCDTSGGSSGSPVLDFATGVVVGIHHNGFKGQSETLVNQAIKLEDILNTLARIIREDIASGQSLGRSGL